MRKFTLVLAAVAAMTANVALAQSISVNYSVNPAAGVASDLQNIVLTFDQEKVYFFENSQVPSVILINETTGTEWHCQDPTRNTNYASETGTQYILTFVDQDSYGYGDTGTDTDEEGNIIDNAPYAPETITEPGEYTLTIRAMYANPSYTQDEEGNPVLDDYDNVVPISVNYTIEYPVDYTLTPESGATEGSISKVILEFPETKNVAFYENMDFVAVITNGLMGDDEIAYYCPAADVNPRAESMGVVYELVFVDEDDQAVEITQEGYWYLTIRGLGITEAQEDGPDVIVADLPVISAVYHIDGSMKVDSLLNNVELNGAVYNLNGVKVGNSLEGLAKGIYIVNGKKVLVK